MPQITNPGRYNVKITDARIKPLEKADDPQAFSVMLLCETPDNFTIFHELFFTRTIIANGKNIGCRAYELAVNTLKSIGVKDGYVGNLEMAIKDGLECSITVENEEYNGKIYTKSKYLNPIKKSMSIAEADVDSIFDDFLKSFMPPTQPKQVIKNEAKPVQAKLMETDSGADFIPF